MSRRSKNSDDEYKCSSTSAPVHTIGIYVEKPISDIGAMPRHRGVDLLNNA